MATVTKGRTFVSGETVTPTKLNELVDLATVTSIQAADIASDAVTNVKIASGVDASKLTTGTLPIARIADAAVTAAKLAPKVTFPNYAAGVDIPYSSGTVYQAATDLYLTVVGTNNFMGAVGVYVGATNNPTAGVWQSGDDINANTKWFGSGPIPIPKDFYYKIQDINVSASPNGPESVIITRYPVFTT